MTGKKEKIAAVDILKTVAILMVIAVHVSQPIKTLPGVISRLLELGQMGVQLFFVISGFLLAKSVSGKREPLGSYYVKKFLRLAPAYYIGIAFYVVLFLVVSALQMPVRIGTNTSWRGILGNFLLLNNLDGTCYNNVVPGGWSISCLWVFYCVFPIWHICATKKHSHIYIYIYC